MGGDGRSAAGADPVRAAQSVLVGVLAVEIAILAITGVALTFKYRPEDAAAWNDIRISDHQAGISASLRVAHRSVAWLSVPTALATGIVTALARGPRRRWPGVVLGAALPLVIVATFLTGTFLPWDQLALWAVTVGDNLDGYDPLLNRSTRWVLMGGAEVAPTTVIRWLVVHAVLGGPLMALLLAQVVRRRIRRDVGPAGTGAGPDGEQGPVPVAAGDRRAW